MNKNIVFNKIIRSPVSWSLLIVAVISLSAFLVSWALNNPTG